MTNLANVVLSPFAESFSRNQRSGLANRKGEVMQRYSVNGKCVDKADDGYYVHHDEATAEIEQWKRVVVTLVDVIADLKKELEGGENVS